MGRGFVGTELKVGGSASHSGFVDIVDTRGGVRGWAVNLANPMDPVRLQLCVGSQVVAETFGETERDDISARLGRAAPAGFGFGAEVMQGLGGYLEDPDDTVVVRVAATGLQLPSAEPPPTIGDILARLRAEAAPQTRNSTADFELLLDELRAASSSLADQALRPMPENLQGYIETIAIDPNGLVWFMGWMKRGHFQEFSAVIVERQKFPAAVAVMSYARDDLPADSCGVVGLVSSTWRPSSATDDLVVFFGAGGRFHLRSHPPLRLLTTGELVSEYEHIRERCLGDGRAIALQRMLTALDNWLPTRTAAQWYAAETSIDRVLLVPGLGCLVEGWVLSPMKRIEGLRLRVGASLMSVHADGLYWKQRPDLLAAFPGSNHMVDRAGFVGLFIGDAEPEDFADPVLKLVFQGGSSANYSIPPNVFRRLGHSAGLQDALLFFPALREEAFFPRFAQAAIRAERTAMAPPVALSIARFKRVLVLVLPTDRCDLFLLFEELANRCRLAGGIEAVAFVAAACSNRSDALWLFREFQAIHGTARNIACSLLLVDEPGNAFAQLPDILGELGATRFFFAGPDVFLTETGWACLRLALAPAANDLQFFGFAPDPFDAGAASDPVSARCFAWSAGAFVRWALRAPEFLGGFYRDNGLAQAATGQIVHPNAARLSRVALPSRIEEAVNAVAYADAEARLSAASDRAAPRVAARA